MKEGLRWSHMMSPSSRMIFRALVKQRKLLNFISKNLTKLHHLLARVKNLYLILKLPKIIRVTYLLMGVYHYRLTQKVLCYVEMNVESFHVVVLRLKRCLSCVLCVTLMSPWSINLTCYKWDEFHGKEPSLGLSWSSASAQDHWKQMDLENQTQDRWIN